jgi:hypothetical protein
MKGKLLVCLSFFILFTCVRAEEDYTLSEFIFDFGVGFSLASCEKDPECAENAPVFVALGLVIGVVLAIFGEKEGGDEFRPRKQAKRFAGGGMGYASGRCLLG